MSEVTRAAGKAVQKATAAKVLDKPVKDEDVEEIEPVEAEAVEEVDADATEPPADVEEEKK